MTLSHNFLKCENMCKTFWNPCFQWGGIYSWVYGAAFFFCLGYIFGSFIWRSYIHFGFLSRWQWSTIISAIAAIPNSSSSFLFVFQQQHSQLLTYFHRPVISPDLVVFPNDLKFSARNFHFPVDLSTIIITFNIHSQLFERTYNSFFCKKSHSQQVHEPAYK